MIYRFHVAIKTFKLFKRYFISTNTADKLGVEKSYGIGR